MRTKIMTTLMVVVSLVLLAACGAPTVETQIQYFQKNIDQMDAMAAKNPALKPTFDVKKAEFQAEFATLKNGTGEEGAKALQALNSRVTRFMNEFAPQPVPGQPVPGQPGSKLGTTAPGQPMPGQPMPVGGVPVQPAVGGKMGGTAVPVQPVPAQPTGGSGFGGAAGGAAVPTPPPVPVQPVQPAQPTGGSGFGGQ